MQEDDKLSTRPPNHTLVSPAEDSRASPIQTLAMTAESYSKTVPMRCEFRGYCAPRDGFPEGREESSPAEDEMASIAKGTFLP